MIILQTETTMNNSYDLYYGLLMYNVNGTEQACHSIARLINHISPVIMASTLSFVISYL